MGRKRKRSWKTNNWAMFEPLERRQHFSVVNVTPANFRAAIQSSNPGDTISFAAGTYPISGHVPFASGRTYVGNGAVLTGAGDQTDLVDLSYTSNVNFSGFVLNGVEATADAADQLTFDNNTMENLPAAYGFYETAMTNSHVDNNAFSQINWCGIYGFPEDGNTFNDNTFDYVHEPIHMAGSQDNTQVNGNVITHATRIGIELQNGMTNLQVENNWMSDWLPQLDSNGNDSHMGISCATGGQGADDAGAGEHITISGNVILQSGPDQAMNHGAKAAIEIMGDLDINVTNNFIWGWGCYLLNGSTGAGVNSSNNIVEATVASDGLYATDSISLPIGKISGTGDTLYAMNDPNAPAVPTTAVSTPPVAAATDSLATTSSAVVQPTVATTAQATDADTTTTTAVPATTTAVPATTTAVPATTTTTATNAVAATTKKPVKAKKKKKKAAVKEATKTSKTDPDAILKSIVRIGA